MARFEFNVDFLPVVLSNDWERRPTHDAGKHCPCTERIKDLEAQLQEAKVELLVLQNKLATTVRGASGMEPKT